MVAQIMHQRPSGVTAPGEKTPDDFDAVREVYKKSIKSDVYKKC